MGLVAPRLLLGPVVAVLVLAFGAASAHAVTYNFSVTPSTPNEDQVTTFKLTPASAEVNSVFWDLDGDGSFDDGSARTVTHTYTSPGTVTVRMAARESSKAQYQVVTKTITVNGRPAADFGFTPGSPLEGQSVAFTPAVTDPEGDSVDLAWDFGDGHTSSTSAPAHTYQAAGTYQVVLTAKDQHGAVTTVEHTVTVASDPGPTPAFTYAPQEPLTDDEVRFESTSTASQGDITATDWDFDGDGKYDAHGSQATWVFTTAGVHSVTMRVRQANGKQATAFSDVTVAERPAPQPQPEPLPPPPDPAPAGPDGGGTVTTPPPTATKPAPKPPVRMRPFPIVRIAGVILPHGARVRILSVRAPRGARVSARCSGRGCPAATQARTSATGLVRLTRFERRLRAGVKLELFVRKANRIGKYTRFVIRAGKAPARVDRCLMPGGKRPVRCG